MMKYKSLLLVLGFLCAALIPPDTLPAQGTSTYHPTRLEREVPEEVRTDLRKSAQGIMTQLGTSALSTEDKEEFAYRVAVELRLYHLSSQLFYDGPIYEYVNQVASNLLRYDDETRSKIKVYISKSTAVNALTFPDGTILVNLGLLLRLKNEAQLAFVLAHEIAHFQKRHGLHKEEKGKEVDLKKKEIKAVFEGTGNPDRLLSLFKFSRENEAEADLEGLALYLQSDYDPQEAIAALEMLKTAGEPLEEGNVNLFMHFQRGDFSVDTASIRSFTRAELEGIQEKETDEEEEVAQKSRKNRKKFTIDDGELSTHPDIDTRVTAIQAQLKSTPKKSGKSQTFVQPEKAFQKVVDAAGFESLLTWGEKAWYSWALYNSLRSFEKDPENQFLIELAAQNMFWLCVLAKTNEEVAPAHNRTTNPGYASLLYFINKFDAKGLNQALKGFLEGYQAEFPKSEVLLILQGRLAGLMEDKATAMTKYDEYLARFPDGDHAPFAQYQKEHAQ
jgi:beta-barrel assembly-enhancing protease